MIDDFIPTTTKGLFIAVFAAVLAITVLFTTGLGPVLLVALFAGVALYVVYAIGARLHNRIVKGSSGGNSGGGA